MIELGPEQCRKIDEALAREWLITNGIGGYASTTIIGAPTRRYHGLLVAAMQPPGRRLALLSQCEEMLTYDGRPYLISTTEYEDGTLAPAGYIHLLQFRLERGLPVTVYEIGDTTLEKWVWMAWGQNTTYIRYRLATTARGPAELRLQPLLSGRPFHQLVRGVPEQTPPVIVEDRWYCLDLPATTRLRLHLTGDRFEPRADWYWRVLYRRERERGLDYSEDLFAPGTLAATLQPGETATLIVSTEPVSAIVTDIEAAWQSEWQRRGQLLQRAGLIGDDAVGQTLVLAADAFLVSRPQSSVAQPTAPSSAVIAGYPWFGEQGRESVIALPGLLLATGRADEARAVLASLIRRRRWGLLPGRWHEESGLTDPAPSEAGLWLAVTLRIYLEETDDDSLLAESWPALVEIVGAYRGSADSAGPIVDPFDGLLRVTEPGGRRGKPVDLNALWYNLLRQMAAWAATRAPERVAEYSLAAERVQTSVNRHCWYAPRGYLADLGAGGETGQDLALRAGQILAIGLPFPVLAPERWRPVLDAVTDHLRTPYGLRTLSPSDPAYIGWYAGDALHREQAQQRGTVWPWLLAPYNAAYRRVYGNNDPLRDQLSAFRRHLRVAGLGFVSEYFDGDTPHSPQGAIAQASSVAAALLLWRATHQLPH